MKHLKIALPIMLMISSFNLSAFAWEPASGLKQIPLWTGKIPDARPYSGPETTKSTKGSKHLVAGEPWIYVENVSQPTITVYPPKGKNTGAAVLVFPGGGYEILAMDLEGTEICDWLNSKGITAVLLKYRVPGVGKFPKSGHYPKSKEALQDAQRALSMVRFNATKWNIDPKKIGVVGFSAGGHLVAASSTHFPKRVYTPVDEADKVSCRPDFAIAVYPGHLAFGEKAYLNPDIVATKQTPPTFILQAQNDPVDRVEHSLVYYAALRKAKVPVEMHLYAEGGHAFGLRRTKSPITQWPELVEKWLKTIQIIQ